MTCGLAIFVKTPGLSPVKTRMCPRLGQRQAETLHLLSAEAVASVAARAARSGALRPYWAVAEVDALGSDAWADLPHLAQGEGGLGERMTRVYDALLRVHGAAMLIGADAPQVQAHDLVQACEGLASGERRLTLGRARDGGFWLFGGNVVIPEHSWTGVTYSAGDTADAFMRSVGPIGRWSELRELHDLDTPDDLAPVLASLRELRDPTPAQSRLADWLLGVVGGTAGSHGAATRSLSYPALSG